MLTDFELGEAAAFFMQGKAAMMWNWSMNLAATSRIPSSPRSQAKVGYAMSPKDTECVHYVREHRWGLCIPRTAPREVAYLFIQWLTSKKTLYKVEAQYKCGHLAPVC